MTRDEHAFPPPQSGSTRIDIPSGSSSNRSVVSQESCFFRGIRVRHAGGVLAVVLLSSWQPGNLPSTRAWDSHDTLDWIHRDPVRSHTDWKQRTAQDSRTFLVCARSGDCCGYSELRTLQGARCPGSPAGRAPLSRAGFDSPSCLRDVMGACPLPPATSGYARALHDYDDIPALYPGDRPVNWTLCSFDNSSGST